MRKEYKITRRGVTRKHLGKLEPIDHITFNNQQHLSRKYKQELAKEELNDLMKRYGKPSKD